jgi:hypothetical protein
MSDQEKQQDHERADPDEKINRQFRRFDFFLVHAARIHSGLRHCRAALSRTGGDTRPYMVLKKERAAIFSRSLPIKPTDCA